MTDNSNDDKSTTIDDAEDMLHAFEGLATVYRDNGLLPADIADPFIARSQDVRIRLRVKSLLDGCAAKEAAKAEMCVDAFDDDGRVLCGNCGNRVELDYSEPHDDGRVCMDCIEGLGREDLPVGLAEEQ